ncbi:unnamed protein product [Oikopleura dioica]|uniref:Uncharacterized protein n=1 Tax=Oikopleura dioica TaxID=34765 RepID=E4Y1R0_OIKDI|nr:unnamed protein product [Oikopleura dioica]
MFLKMSTIQLWRRSPSSRVHSLNSKKKRTTSIRSKKGLRRNSFE